MHDFTPSKVMQIVCTHWTNPKMTNKAILKAFTLWNTLKSDRKDMVTITVKKAIFAATTTHRTLFLIDVNPSNILACSSGEATIT